MEILAVVFAAIILVKVFVTFTKPSLRVKLIEEASKHKTFTSLLYLALALLTGYTVIGYLGVVNVAAVMLFTFFLMGFAVMPYVDQILKISKPYFKDPFALLVRSWPSLIIWLGFAVWVLKAVFW